MNKAKTKQRERVNEDSYESSGNLGRGLLASVKQDVAKGFAHDFWEQMLMAKGEQNGKASGDMQAGQEVTFKKQEVQQEVKKTQEAVKRVDAGIDYAREIIHAERRIQNEGSQHLAMRIEEIVVELKKLSKSSKTLEVQFKEITTIAMPKTPGKYHQNFFEWTLSVVRSARTRVESAEQWLKAVSGKGKKKDFWGMYKKHGTSFGLSGERAVAQQSG